MTTRELFDRIRESWGRDTSSPGTLGEGPCGQCAVTALVVQDECGGELLRAEIPDLGSHYWNLLPGGVEVDLTRGQYPPDLPIPRGLVVGRVRLLDGDRAAKARTVERYEVLRARVFGD